MRDFGVMMKRLLAVVITVAGMGGEVHALTFGEGDLVLTLYNTQYNPRGREYIQNLGSINTLLAPGTSSTFNLSAAYPWVNGPNPVHWSLLAFECNNLCANDGDALFNFSSTKPVQSWTPYELISTIVPQALTQAVGWSAIPSSGLYEYFFGYDGTMAGAFPVSTHGGFGSLLYILQGDAATKNLINRGYAFLSSDGLTLTINAGVAPVPLPPASVMFFTGLIGLLRIRRKRSG